MKPIPLAIIGAGVWGDTHAAIYREHPLAMPVAICDLDKSRAQKVAAAHGIPNVFTSVHELFAYGQFDAVSIVTPDHQHADIAVQCAAHGKHMLIEKPLATKRDDVFRILNAARRHTVRVMVDLHNRWSPPFAAARQAIERGELGTLRTAYFRLNDIQWVATDTLSWSAQSSILWFLGSHSLDTLQWLFGDQVVRVYAVSTRGVLDNKGVSTVDSYLTTLEFRNGGIAQMENGWITPNGNPCVNDIKCNLLGDKGMVAIDTSHHNMVQLYTESKVTVPDVLVRNHVFGQVRGFAYESIRSFVDCLATGRDFHISLEDAARTSLAILSIIQSAETRQPVVVDNNLQREM